MKRANNSLTEKLLTIVLFNGMIIKSIYFNIFIIILIFIQNLNCKLIIFQWKWKSQVSTLVSSSWI